MSTFVDTSALLSVLDAREQRHAEADAAWREMNSAGADLMTCNYVVVETTALVQARLGLAAVRVLLDDLLAPVRIHWMDAGSHAAAVSALLAANRRQLSLVDCASFETMRRLGIRRVFAFDPHFADQGFELVP